MNSKRSCTTCSLTIIKSLQLKPISAEVLNISDNIDLFMYFENIQAHYVGYRQWWNSAGSLEPVPRQTCIFVNRLLKFIEPVPRQSLNFSETITKISENVMLDRFWEIFSNDINVNDFRNYVEDVPKNR